MDRYEYVALFEELGFYCQDREGDLFPPADAYYTGRPLRHPGADLPTIYFAGNEEEGVRFAVYLDDLRHFPPEHWDEIGPHGAEDPGRITNLVPRSGHERAAFVALLE